MSEGEAGARVHRIAVRWAETDAAGIAFYPNYFAWFDLATMEFFEALDPPFSERVRAERLGLPLVEAHCRFLAPAGYRDELWIASRVTEVRERSFRIEHEVFRGEVPVARGYEVRVLARLDPSLRGVEPLPIPEEMRALMGVARALREGEDR